MASNVGLPVLIGAVVATAVVAGGAVYFLAGSGEPAVATPAPIAAPAAVAGGAVDPNAPRIAVIDRNAILGLSEAGKAMMADAEALSTAADREFQAQASALQTEAAALQQELAILAPDVRAERERAFINRQNALQGRIQARQTQIQNGFAIAGQQLDQALQPILQQILVERGANLLVDREAVILAAIDVDVTPLAIQRLNEVLPTLDVELSDNPPQAPVAPDVAAAAEN